MLSRLLAFSLSQRLFVLGVAFALSVAGTIAAVQLPIDAFPEIAPTQVKIVLKAPGMTPEEVEARVIVPLEMELLGIPRQTVMRARAKYAIADITIDFEDGTDVYWARQQVAERLAAVRGDLPESVEGGLAPISTALSELFMFTVESDSLSLEERRSLLDWVIRPSLRTLPGVAEVNALGGRVRSFDVVPDEAAMLAAGVTTAELLTALESNNRNDGAGRINDGEEALVVRSVGASDSPASIAALVVRRDPESPVRISDVADVRLGALTRYGSVTRDGEGETVQGIVVALRGADARAVVAAVEARLTELQAGFPESVEIVPFYNRSDLIERAVGTVSEALIIAVALVVAILLVFLGNLRAAIVVTLILPFAALVTFLLMKTFGLSANLMSLGGLAIAIGMIVDGAIVVTENTVERLNEKKAGNRLHTVFRAACEVSVPTVAGTLIICLVFLPLITLQGLEGKLFAPVALTIVFALGGAMVLALTLIPVLASFTLRPNDNGEAWIMRMIGPAFAWSLERALKAPALVYGVAGVAVLAAIASYASAGKTFMPTMDEGAVVMQLASLPSINLDQSQADDLRVEAALVARVPEVRHVIARVGSDELGLDPMSLNESDAFLQLAPRDEWRQPDRDWLIGEMRAVMDDFPGIESSFTQPIEMRVSEMLTGSRGDLAVKVFGPDAQTLARLAGEIERAIADVPGAADVFTTANDLAEYLQVSIDPERAGRFGFDVLSVQDELRSRLEGLQAGTVIEPERRTAILVRSDRSYRETPWGFENIRMSAPVGGESRLGDIAEVTRSEGLAVVDRENGSRYAVVQAFVSGRDLVGFVQEAQAVVDALDLLPPGYRIEWGGEFENQRRAAARLGLMVPLALVLILVVLFVTLRSLRQACLILANIPFALVGGMIALGLSGEYLSVPASVGFIALLGVAVLNGLVLITHFNDLQALGQSIDSIVLQGTRRRLRPVLMTATTAAFGLVPLLFATGPGAEIQKPLAIVVIGGLVSSTILTLYLLPLLYRRFGVERVRLQAMTEEARWVRPFAN